MTSKKLSHNLWKFSKKCTFPLIFHLSFDKFASYKCMILNLSIFWAKYSRKIRVNFQSFLKNINFSLKLSTKSINFAKIRIFLWFFEKICWNLWRLVAPPPPSDTQQANHLEAHPWWTSFSSLSLEKIPAPGFWKVFNISQMKDEMYKFWLKY